MKKLVALFLSLVFSVALMAQDKVFTVMAVQGAVTNGGKTVGVGSQLSSNAVLTLGDRAYIGLLHKSGNSVEFKAAGNYDLKAQHDKLASKTKGFQQKYMDYVVSGVTAKNGGGSYQRNMSVTGSVDRALAKNEIIVPLPMKVTLINENFGISWMDEAKDQTYTITVTNMKEEPVAKFESSSSSAQIDLSQVALESEQYYLLTVTSQNGKRKSNTVNFFIPGNAEKKQLMDELKEVSESMDLETSVGLAAYGQICEDKKLMLEALQAYKKAKELSPDVDYFNTQYKNFLDEVVAAL